MAKLHFDRNDDFRAIIRRPVEQIPTGWTNYVFRTTGRGPQYVVRFPRDEYWVETIKKEHWFNKFIRGKVPVQVVKLRLKRCGGDNPPHTPRFYSIHKLIHGQTLTEAFPRMTDAQKRVLASDIVKYIRALNAVDIKKIKLPLFSTFCEGVARQTNDPTFNYKEIFAPLYKCEVDETKLVLTHGDFNIGNIIVDDNMRMVAVLDYAFACRFVPAYADLAVVLTRLPRPFHDILVAEYENTGEKLDRALLDAIINVRLEIEKDYARYMVKTHPDIQF